MPSPDSLTKKNTRKITTQYLLLLIPAIALLFITFGIVVYYLGKPQAMKANHELSEIIARKTNQALIRWLEEQIRTAQTIARDPGLWIPAPILWMSKSGLPRKSSFQRCTPCIRIMKTFPGH